MNQNNELSNTRILLDVKEEYSIKVRILAAACSICAGFGRNYVFNSLVVLKTIIKLDLGINNFQYAFFNVMPYISGVFVPIVGGIIIGKTGHTNGCIFSIILLTTGSIIVSFVPLYHSYIILMSGQFFLGLGSTFLYVASGSLMAKYFRGPKLAKMIGVDMTLSNVISLTSSLTTLPFYDILHYYGVNFLISIILNIVGLLLIILYSYTKKRFISKSKTANIVRKQKEEFYIKNAFQFQFLFWMIITIRFFKDGLFYSITPNLVEFVSIKFELNQTLSSYYTNLPKIILIIFSIPIGILLKKIQKDLLLLFCSVMGAVSTFILFFTKTNPAISVSLDSVIFLLYTMTIFTIKSTIIKKRYISTAFGISSAVANLGNIIFNLMSGLVQDANKGSYENLSQIWLGLSFIPILLSIWYVLHNRLCIRNEFNFANEKDHSIN